MPDTFNGYHVWLGIPASEQPPHHYRLLGIAIFESDLDVIDHAADRQMAHVRTFQSGRHQALSQQILNELSGARVCLLSAERKAAYDEQLRSKLGSVPKAAPVLMAKAVPVAQAIATAAVPLVKPNAKTKPLPSNSPTAAKPRIDHSADDMIALDIEPVAEGSVTLSSTIPLRARRRSRRHASSWQRSALLGVVAAVAVTGMILFYFFVKWAAQHDWSGFDSSFLEPHPAAPAAAPERAEAAEPAPQPAAGGDSAADADEAAR